MPSLKKITIVGAGLVGQLLARALARKGRSVTLVHDPAQPGASRVAAWMINPVTGIRFVPSWRVETFLPAAIALYRELEAESGLKIWRPLPIRRLFQGADELPRWEKKRLLPEVSRYVTAEDADGIIFHSGGWADLGPWLAYHLEHPTGGIEVVQGKMDRSMATDALTVFCTGYAPSVLPWKPAKGELLTVRIPDFDLRHILLRGIFIIPITPLPAIFSLGDMGIIGSMGDLYRVGATYEWDDLSPDCTEAGRHHLTEKLAALIQRPFAIVDQQTAIRPILQDARPVLGLDPDDPRFGICNGFGSKAALQAPAATAHFADYLMGHTPLDPEMSLHRL